LILVAAAWPHGDTWGTLAAVAGVLRFPPPSRLGLAQMGTGTLATSRTYAAATRTPPRTQRPSGTPSSTPLYTQGQISGSGH